MEQSTAFADLQIISESVIQGIRRPVGISSRQSYPPDGMMSSLARPTVASPGTARSNAGLIASMAAFTKV
jgi:hypothetical protein